MQRVLSWFFVFVWTLIIYTSAFYAVPLAREMFTRFNMNAVMCGVFAALLLGGGALFFLMRKNFTGTPQKIGLLTFLLFTFAVEYYFAERHAKRFHMMEYSILSILLHRAFQLDFKGARLWVLVFGAALLVGLGDEAFQHWIPERVSSLSDIWVNIKSVFLTLAFLALMSSQHKKTS